MTQYEPKKDRIARLKPTAGKLYPNLRRYNSRCPDFTGECRSPRGEVFDTGLWVVHQLNGKHRLDIQIKDIADPWQVPYDQQAHKESLNQYPTNTHKKPK